MDHVTRFVSRYSSIYGVIHSRSDGTHKIANIYGSRDALPLYILSLVRVGLRHANITNFCCFTFITLGRERNKQTTSSDGGKKAGYIAHIIGM